MPGIMRAGFHAQSGSLLVCTYASEIYICVYMYICILAYVYVHPPRALSLSLSILYIYIHTRICDLACLSVVHSYLTHGFFNSFCPLQMQGKASSLCRAFEPVGGLLGPALLRFRLRAGCPKFWETRWSLLPLLHGLFWSYC